MHLAINYINLLHKVNNESTRDYCLKTACSKLRITLNQSKELSKNTSLHEHLYVRNHKMFYFIVSIYLFCSVLFLRGNIYFPIFRISGNMLPFPRIMSEEEALAFPQCDNLDEVVNASRSVVELLGM